eukprot:3047494-Prymnesium_polylepis.1
MHFSRPRRLTRAVRNSCTILRSQSAHRSNMRRTIRMSDRNFSANWSRRSTDRVVGARGERGGWGC